MSERPTPETDDEKIYRLIVEQADLLSRLGITEIQIDKAIRERDELREALRTLAEHGEKEIQRVTKERDKARKELEEVRAERDILRLDAQREAEHHDRMVGELEKLYRERDEARAERDILRLNSLGTK